jgi:murein DD-endopeptidase MepM/ murein hydrolase activator NlpD
VDRLFSANNWTQPGGPADWVNQGYDWNSLTAMDPFASGAGWASQATAPYTFDQRRNPYGPSYDPAYGSGIGYDAASSYSSRLIDDQIQRWLQAEYPELFDFSTGGVNSGFGGQAGSVSQDPSFGQFANDPTVFAEIQAAADKYGVPANLLKVMIARESSGDWSGNSHATYLPSRGERIVGYTGIMESTAKAWGYDFDALIGNRALQIDAMANGLNRLYQNVGGQYGWDGVISVYYSGDPSQTYTPPDSTQYGTTAAYVARVNEWWQDQDAWSVANGGTAWAPNAGGLATPDDPNWAKVNQWDASVARYASQYGVPPNLMKAIMRVESGGDPNARNPSGATGLMQIMADIWNGGNWQQLLDPEFNIKKSAEILRANYDQHGSWEMAARAYLGLSGTDNMGNDQHSYWAMVDRYWNELDANASGMFGGEAKPVQAVTNLNAIWGGQEFPISQEHGPTEFSLRPENRDMYDYSLEYMDTWGHPGIDVAMPVGTKLYAPANGTVIFAGGTGYYVNELGSNPPQTGELRIQLDNGHEVILGHMAGIHLPVGARVQAGTYVGVSGYPSAPHVHLEYRIPNTKYRSGWEAVDPRQALRGVFGGGFSGNASGAGINRPMSFNEMMIAAASGKPLYNTAVTTGVSGWNTFLQNAMSGSLPYGGPNSGADPVKVPAPTAGGGITTGPDNLSNRNLGFSYWYRPRT